MKICIFALVGLSFLLQLSGCSTPKSRRSNYNKKFSKWSRAKKFTNVKIKDGLYTGYMKKKSLLTATGDMSDTYWPSGKGTFTNKHGVNFEGTWNGIENAKDVMIFLYGSSVYFRFKVSQIKELIPQGDVEFSKVSQWKPFKNKRDYQSYFNSKEVTLSQNILNFTSLRYSKKNDHNFGNNTIYSGFLDKQGKKQGTAKFIMPGGDVYVGTFHNDLFHGIDNEIYRKDGSYEKCSHIGSFKEGLCKKTLKNKKRYVGLYKRGREDGWRKYGSYHMFKRALGKNRRIQGRSHMEGILERIENGKVVETYDLSDPQKYTTCEVSNLYDSSWIVQVPGKSCSGAKVGFTGALNIRLNNLKISKKKPYKIMNADLETLFGFNYYIGNYRKSEGHITFRDYHNRKVLYQGDFHEGKPSGVGFCLFNEILEPCNQSMGIRNDEIHQAREYDKLLAAEAAKVAKAKQDCVNLNNGYNRNMNFFGNAGFCDNKISPMQNALNIVINKADCKGCGQREFKNAAGNMWSCIKKLKSDLQYANAGTGRMVRLGCISQNESNLMTKDLNSAIRSARKQAPIFKSIENDYRASYKKIIWPKLDRIETQRNAVWMGAINKFKRASQNIMAQKQRMHNQRMGYIRDRQRIDRQAKERQRKISLRSRALKVPTTLYRYNPKTKKKVKVIKRDVYAESKKLCKKRARKWLGDRCDSKISVITFPGRACYDPTGKICKTGETIYYDKNSGKYNPKYTRSDSNVKATQNKAITNSGNSDGDTSSATTAAIRKTVIPKLEALAYCWPNKRKTGWYCHGSTQLLLMPSKTIESAMASSGCRDGSKKTPFQDGVLFYCGFGQETYHDDVVSIYNVDAGFLSARRKYDCNGSLVLNCKTEI